MRLSADQGSSTSIGSNVHYRKILIIGPCGAGKSTLARSLAPSLELPLIHLDREYWRPGWIKTPTAAWRERVAALVARPRWLMDGNFSGTFDLRFPSADAILILDLPRRVYLTRVIRRSLLGHGRARADLAEGCHERFDPAFLRYVWAFRHTMRPRIFEALTEHDVRGAVYHLRTRRAVRTLLRQAQARGRLPPPC